jgi:hypothetical protein
MGLNPFYILRIKYPPTTAITNMATVRHYKHNIQPVIQTYLTGSPVVTICTTMFNIKKLYILPTQCMYSWNKQGLRPCTGRSRVRFPMVSLEFFTDIIVSVALWPWGRLQPLTEMSTRNLSWGVKAALPPSCAVV